MCTTITTILTEVQNRRLNVEGVYQSKHVHSSRAVTMLVTANTERLDLLPGLCASWTGVVSAAVYVATVADQSAEEAAAIRTTAMEAVKEVHDK